MDEKKILEQIKTNAVLGHMDREDEGFDGTMEGQDGVSELTTAALEGGVDVQKVLDTLSAGMELVGQKFESGEYLIPDMLAGAECVGKAMEIAEPYLVKGGVERKGTFVIATVEGDLHDIGKNIVTTMLKGEGYEVKDLGINIPADRIVSAVKESGAGFLGLSALLTTTMTAMQPVIDGLKSEGLRDKVKVLIGGAPTSPEFAEKIGADAHCKDAFEAITMMNRYKKEAA